jgi:hypothetical protein
MQFTKKFRIEKHLVECLFILAIVTFMLFIELSHDSYAEVEYWAVEAGDKELAVLHTKEDADAVIDKVEQYYTEDEAKNVRVSVEPVLTSSQRHYAKKDAPRISKISEAVKVIAAKTKGDSPLIRVTTTQTYTSTEEVGFSTSYKKTDSLIKGAVKVKDEGKAGEKLVTSEVVTVNGKETSKEVISEKVMKKAHTRLVLEGTAKDDKVDKKGEEGSAGRLFHVKQKGKIYVADKPGKVMGQYVADYALNFVGNPYVYGGESLTDGADCSGFTMAVYRHFGISMPHGAHQQRAFGRSVKLSNARAGDLICYNGHIGIYIGNNKLVHAMNPANGITVSRIGYNGKAIVTIQRLFW